MVGYLFLISFYVTASNAARRQGLQERNNPNLDERVSHADWNVDGVVGGRQRSVFEDPRGVDEFGAIHECFL